MAKGNEIALRDGRREKIEAVLDQIVRGLDSEHTRVAYRRAVSEFFAWLEGSEYPSFTRAAVAAYKDKLREEGKSAAVVNQSLSAIRRAAQESAELEWMPQSIAESICRVRGVKASGVRLGNWLSKEETEKLLNAPNSETMLGLRDRALLAVLIGCGLRRSEARELCVKHLQQRDGRWLIADIRGKRNKVRSVPMPAWCKGIIDVWCEAAGINDGYIFRRASWSRTKRDVSDATTAQAVMRCVKRYGAKIGRPELAPHDLRRTYAKLSRKGGAPLEQIQITLGHDSLDTTKRYLGSELDLQNAPGDMLGLDVTVDLRK